VRSAISSDAIGSSAASPIAKESTRTAAREAPGGPQRLHQVLARRPRRRRSPSERARPSALRASAAARARGRAAERARQAGGAGPARREGVERTRDRAEVLGRLELERVPRSRCRALEVVERAPDRRAGTEAHQADAVSWDRAGEERRRGDLDIHDPARRVAAPRARRGALRARERQRRSDRRAGGARGVEREHEVEPLAALETGGDAAGDEGRRRAAERRPFRRVLDRDARASLAFVLGLYESAASRSVVTLSHPENEVNHARS
jgi:hypothetical protein